MTLVNLRRIGKLRAHVAERAEIDRLLDSADLRLRDASVPGLGADSRFGLAYDAILKAALAAMLASGYRPVTSEPGHHQTLIQALVKTVQWEPQAVVVLEAYRKLRNKSDYEGEPVGESVAAACIGSARQLLDGVRHLVRDKYRGV